MEVPLLLLPRNLLRSDDVSSATLLASVLLHRKLQLSASIQMQAGYVWPGLRGRRNARGMVCSTSWQLVTGYLSEYFK